MEINVNQGMWKNGIEIQAVLTVNDAFEMRIEFMKQVAQENEDLTYIEEICLDFSIPKPLVVDSENYYLLQEVSIREDPHENYKRICKNKNTRGSRKQGNGK